MWVKDAMLTDSFTNHISRLLGTFIGEVNSTMTINFLFGRGYLSTKSLTHDFAMTAFYSWFYFSEFGEFSDFLLPKIMYLFQH